MTESMFSGVGYAAKAILISASIAAMHAWSQPSPFPTAGDLPCMDSDSVMANYKDHEDAAADAEGYFPLFDGSFKGWFNNCGTAHSRESAEGAIFRIGLAGGHPAIFANQRGPNIGGALMTYRKFADYEITFQFWPEFGSRGGLLNRANLNGRAFRTMLDYSPAMSIGGSWGESGFTFRDIRPFRFKGDGQSIEIPIDNPAGAPNWTSITRSLKSSAEPGVPCPDSGCAQSQWQDLWDPAGWNEIKVRFYGGAGLDKGAIRMKSWFKKPSAEAWVPLLQDTTLAQVVPAGHIGFQVTGDSEFNGTKGTWYRNIRWKPLDELGRPVALPQTGIHSRRESDRSPFRFSADAYTLAGTVEGDYSITVMDPMGGTLENFSGKAGKVEHAFATGARGILILAIRTAQGIGSAVVLRPPD
jgi:hypothetical protein